MIGRNMFGLDVKVVLLFALLGTALAFRTSNVDEADSPSADVNEMADDELELAPQQDKDGDCCSTRRLLQLKIRIIYIYFQTM